MPAQSNCDIFALSAEDRAAFDESQTEGFTRCFCCAKKLEQKEGKRVRLTCGAACRQMRRRLLKDETDAA